MTGPILVLLAAAPATVDPTDPGNSDVGTAGPTGLALTVGLLIAAALLVYSMNRHLKRLPRSFQQQDDVPPVPDTPEELLASQRAPGQDLLDELRRAPRAIEPPRRDENPPGGSPQD